MNGKGLFRVFNIRWQLDQPLSGAAMFAYSVSISIYSYCYPVTVYLSMHPRHNDKIVYGITTSCVGEAIIIRTACMFLMVLYTQYGITNVLPSSTRYIVSLNTKLLS